MADNTELFLGSGGDDIRTDELSPGLKVQLVKLMPGSNGNEEEMASTTRPFPMRNPSGVGSASRATVNDTGTVQVAPVQADRIAVILKNVGANACDLAINATPTFGASFPLEPGESISLTTTQQVLARCDTGLTTSVAKLDMYN